MFADLPCKNDDELCRFKGKINMTKTSSLYSAPSNLKHLLPRSLRIALHLVASWQLQVFSALHAPYFQSGKEKKDMMALIYSDISNSGLRLKIRTSSICSEYV